MFMNREGALANLKFFADKFEIDNMKEMLTIEYIESSGISTLVKSREQAMALMSRLDAEKSK